MRFAASPLMVAVALGLLAPSVLEAEADPELSVEGEMSELSRTDGDRGVDAPAPPSELEERGADTV